MTTTTIRTGTYPDTRVLVDCAEHETNHDAMMLIGIVTGVFGCEPQEGIPGVVVSFTTPDGKGYTLSYRVDHTEWDTAALTDIFVERTPVFDDDIPAFTARELIEAVGDRWAVVAYDGSDAQWLCNFYESRAKAQAAVSDTYSDFRSRYTYRVVRICG